MNIWPVRTQTVETGFLYLNCSDIRPSPVQPRRHFDEDALQELAESIREYGVLNPLTVRARSGHYELVAGERRWRAAKLAGLRTVPCNLLDVDMERAGLLALVENLQRKDLDFVEEALGIQQLIRLFGMNQEEAARRIGKSQSAVANKLRLLKLPEDVLEELRLHGLGERHGRALLRLPGEEEQRKALRHMIEREMTAAAADSYVDELLEGKSPAAPARSFAVKDVRLFLNTIRHSLSLMKQGGIDAGMERRETEDALILTISIPKKPSSLT